MESERIHVRQFELNDIIEMSINNKWKKKKTLKFWYD